MKAKVLLEDPFHTNSYCPELRDLIKFSKTVTTKMRATYSYKERPDDGRWQGGLMVAMSDHPNAEMFTRIDTLRATPIIGIWFMTDDLYGNRHDEKVAKIVSEVNGSSDFNSGTIKNFFSQRIVDLVFSKWSEKIAELKQYLRSDFYRDWLVYIEKGIFELKKINETILNTIGHSKQEVCDICWQYADHATKLENAYWDLGPEIEALVEILKPNSADCFVVVCGLNHAENLATILKVENFKLGADAITAEKTACDDTILKTLRNQQLTNASISELNRYLISPEQIKL